MDVVKLNDFPINPIQGQIYEIIPDKAKIVASTNRLFNKYPTRYISAVPRFPINAYSKKGDYVLDPFCGSGTTAIEAMILGRNAISIDIDPFARLLIKVKTTVYTEEDISFLKETISRMRKLTPDCYRCPPQPEIPNIDKWFCEESIKGINFLKTAIDELTSINDKIHDYLYVTLAAIIRKASNADEVSPKPYVSTRYPKTPAEPLELFYKTETLYRDAIIEFSETVAEFGCTSEILKSNDARNINGNQQIDLAVTSPPYINAYDYVRSLKFEDIWLGLASYAQLKKSRESYIGTEIRKSFYSEYIYASQSKTLEPLTKSIEIVDVKRANIVKTYFEDMAKNLIAVCEQLKKNGRYAIVVGDSKIRNQDIPTATILTEIAERNGYSFDLSFKYVIRDRYLHLPRGNRGGIIKYDEVLVLKKD